MLSNLRHFSLICGFTLLAAATHAQNTINVGPGQTYTTIQSGINAANNGDTVKVAAGTYFENINTNGKTITLTGIVPAAGQTPPTIIDGSSSGPAITIDSDESPTISNFTVQHGGSFSTDPTVDGTGGIYISGGSPTISSNLITGNNCWGIESSGSSAQLIGNTISATQDPNGDCGITGGAGILIDGDQVIQLAGAPIIIPAFVSGNTIEDNVQSGFEGAGTSGGAGIAIEGGTSSIVNNIIHDNASPGGTGGGINVFSSAGYDGHAITILQNLIYNNSAGCGGGAIATPISHNGGEINLLIANNTMVNNTGEDSAGDMECQSISQIDPAPSTSSDTEFLSGSGTVITNNIIVGSSADPSINCSPYVTPSELTQPLFDHNILRNAGGAFFGSFCIDTSAKYGNSTADPNLDTDPANLYHPIFSPTSPVIDSGNNSVLAIIPQLTKTSFAVDAAGNPRVQDGKDLGYPVIDIGAYEYTPQTAPGNEDPPNTILFTPSAYSGTINTDFTFTAALYEGTGTVTFYSNGQPIPNATAPIIDGVATAMNIQLPTGIQGVTAVYGPQNGFPPAVSLPAIIDVPLISTSVVLTSQSVPPPIPAETNSSQVGQPVLFTVRVLADDGTIPQPITITSTYVPTSTTTVLTEPPGLTPDSSGMATLTYPGFSTIGSYEIKAAYAGDKTHTAASDTITQNVTGLDTITTLTCPSSIPFGGTATIVATVTSTSGTPGGQIFLSDAGVAFGGDPQLVNGSASVTYTADNSGNRTIVAQYFASGNYSGSSGTCSITVLPQNTLTLTSSSPLVNNIPTAPAYSPITFTAVLNTSATPTGVYTIDIQGPSGPITGTMQADAAGTTATYTTSALAPGQYNVSSTFTFKNSNLTLQATLYPYQLVTAAVGDFTLTGPSSITARTESPASGTLSLTSIAFQGTVALTCNLPLPTTYTCAIAPTGVPLVTGGTGSAIVTLTPSLNRAANESASRIVFASLLPLTLLSFAGFIRRRKLPALLPLAILAILAATTTACGNDIAYPATQPGSYPFTITATGTTQGGTAPDTHTLNITLVLTP